MAAMKIDMQTLNKAIEEAKNKVQNSEEEVRIRRLQVVAHSYQLHCLFECKSVVYPHTLYWVVWDHKLSQNERGRGMGKMLSRSALVSHTSRFFVVELPIFIRGQIGLKFVRQSACHRLADVLSRLTACGPVIQSQDGAYSTDVTLRTFPNWLRRAQAPTSCLGPPHSSRQSPTFWNLSSDKPWSCCRLVGIHCTLADNWRFFVRRE